MAISGIIYLNNKKNGNEIWNEDKYDFNTVHESKKIITYRDEKHVKK